MEKLVEKGLCKAIGISNFTINKTQALLETARIVPACNQGMLMGFKSLEYWCSATASVAHKDGKDDIFKFRRLSCLSLVFLGS